MVGQVRGNSVAGAARSTEVCITNYPFYPWNRTNYNRRGKISSPDRQGDPIPTVDFEKAGPRWDRDPKCPR